MSFVWSLILLLLLPIYSYSQTIEKPVIPDDVLWEPDIEYLTAGAKTVNLAMDVVTPKGSGGPLSCRGLHPWRWFSQRRTSEPASSVY